MIPDKLKKEGIATPKEIGDNQFVVKFKGEYKLKVGYAEEEYFIQILKGKESYLDKSGSTPIWEKNSVKNDIIDWAVATELFSKKINAKNHLIKLLSSCNTNIIKIKDNVSNVSNVSKSNILYRGDKKNSFFFDTKNIVKKVFPSVGVLDKHFYFGFNLVYSSWEKNDKGIYKELQKEQLVFVLDNHELASINEEFMEKNNIRVDGRVMQEPSKTRWSLPEIQNFTEFQGINHEFEFPKPLKLFSEIKQVYEQYVDLLDKEFYDIHVLWDLGTYFHQLFVAYPYFNLWGIKGSAKTKIMEVSRLFSFNPEKFVNMSEASVFRIVDRNKPTLYVDEAENLWNKGEKGEDDTSDIVALFNAGWLRGDRVPRVNKQDPDQIDYFDPYCPKMFASIKGLKGALQDRCITEVTIKASKDDKRGDLWPEETEEIKNIRDRIYRFVMRNWKDVLFNYNTMEKEFNISNRNWQIWKPLLAIAKLIDNKIYKRVGMFAEKNMVSLDIISEDSWDSRIIEVLTTLVKEEGEIKCYVKDIKDKVSYFYGERERKPNSEFIGKFMNKIGFRKYRRRDKSVYYILSKKRVNFILSRCNMAEKHTQPTSLTPPIKEEETTLKPQIIEEEVVED